MKIKLAKNTIKNSVYEYRKEEIDLNALT